MGGTAIVLAGKFLAIVVRHGVKTLDPHAPMGEFPLRKRYFKTLDERKLRR